MVNLQDLFSDKYCLSRRINKNSPIASFRARDRSTHDEVVIRVPEEATDLSINFIENEIKVLSCVNHKNIVKLVSTGCLSDGRPYLILKWIDGISIEQYLTNNKLSVRECLEVITAVTNALEAVHNAYFIHRDIKPANVIIPAKNRKLLFGNAVLIDFGSIGSLDVTTGSTNSGELFGTPYYMSPEQLLAQPQNPSTDFYSLGALFYEMLYKSPPFIGVSPKDVFDNILSQEVLFLDVPDALPGIFEVVRRCLDKNPNRRPSCASELISDLNDLMKEYTEVSSVINSLDFNSVGVPKKMAGAISPEFLGIIAGAAVTFSGVGGGIFLHQWLDNKLPDKAKNAIEFKSQARTRSFLTETLAMRFNTLSGMSSDPYGQALGTTMQLYLKEFKEAKASDDRVAALSAAITTAEKLAIHVSPWYVRYEKVIASFVSVLGALVGLVGVVVNVKKLRNKPSSQVKSS